MTTITLHSQFTRFLDELVKSGTFSSREEAAEDAILRRKKEIDWLRAELKPSIDELNQGKGIVWNPKKIKAEGRKRLASRMARVSKK